MFKAFVALLGLVIACTCGIFLIVELIEVLGEELFNQILTFVGLVAGIVFGGGLFLTVVQQLEKG